MEVGKTIKVRASEFCGTPATEAVILRVLPGQGPGLAEYSFAYDVWDPSKGKFYTDDVFQVDCQGYVLIGPPSRDGKLTRAP